MKISFIFPQLNVKMAFEHPGHVFNMYNFCFYWCIFERETIKPVSGCHCFLILDLILGNTLLHPFFFSPNMASDTMVKHLQSADAYRSFTEFRQEASMLRSLQHPCIVHLVGINIHPLCFALQLAPLGSLNTVLEEKHKGKGTSCHSTAQHSFDVR